MVFEIFRPSPDQLNTDSILREIVHNIKDLADLYANIDTYSLQELCEKVRQDRINSEDVIRAFCLVFQDTCSFAFSFDQLELDTQTKISAVVDGRAATDVVSAEFTQKTLRMGNISAPQYLKQVGYKAEIAESKEILVKIGKRQGWVHDDLQQRFSNQV
ncbi:hypothetical protein MBLNU459_g6134t1 [Dothideomycetes sp. NU459]